MCLIWTCLLHRWTNSERWISTSVDTRQLKTNSAARSARTTDLHSRCTIEPSDRRLSEHVNSTTSNKQHGVWFVHVCSRDSHLYSGRPHDCSSQWECGIVCWTLCDVISYWLLIIIAIVAMHIVNHVLFNTMEPIVNIVSVWKCECQTYFFLGKQGVRIIMAFFA